jgi:NhaP-type Na+/H+ or K+/H+ antiporter
VIFVAYAVILLTLVVPGLTLAPLVRRVGLMETEEHRRRDADARLRLANAALERLEDISDDAPDHIVERLRDRYGSRVERLEARVEGDHDDHGRSDVAVTAKLMAEMIEAERDVLRAMRREGEIPADVLREIERELDLDESRLRARIRL